MADDLLLQTDRSGMAHGLEIRVPYLDPVVAEFARSLPLGARLRGRQTKRVLRAALAPLLPRPVVRGPKRGFVAPAAAWLRGPLRPLAADVLSEATLRRQGLVDPAAAAALLDRHVRRREDVSRGLWALLALTLWHDAVLARPPVAGALDPDRGGVRAGHDPGGGRPMKPPIPSSLLASAVAVLALAVAPAAHAQDPIAPPGAEKHWLPPEPWVNDLWLPYEEARLYRLLGRTRGEVFRWVRVDAHHTMAQLARRRGWTRRAPVRRARRPAPRRGPAPRCCARCAAAPR